MENQHRQIKGYRDLSEGEIADMNEIKEMAARVGVLVEKLRESAKKSGSEESSRGADQRWVSIGATDLQTGFMALTRSIAKPEFF